MAFEYIKEKNLLQGFKDASMAALPLHEPMEEWERIARNIPYPGIPKNMPKVTDGTLAALIQEQPKRVIQQVPTGVVTGADPTINVIGTYILTKEILPNNDQVAALIQKSWAMTSKCLTYGSQPVFVQTVMRGDYFGSDFTLPYVKDVLLEPGKLSDRDSNVIWLISWFAPSQIDAIIAKERGLIKRSKKRGDTEPYDSSWDIPALKAAKKAITQKDNASQTPNERGKNLNQGYIKLVTAFQRGVGATFYTFCPDLPEDKNVVRRKVSKDPRGRIPIHYMYANVDLSNPLGRGSVELSGGMQNLLDSEVQSYQYMRALLMNPPLEIKGNVPNVVFKYAPQAQWRIGTDPAAGVAPVKLETASLQQFPDNYGLIKSQILNLNSSADTSVSSESGNPGFSKTDAGVQATEQKLGISDNYMQKQFEDTFQEVCETEINLYFAERSGTQELEVDEETADKLRDLGSKLVNDKNMVRINYDTETPILHFKVDAGSSAMEDDQDQIAGLQQLLKDAQGDPYLVYQFAAEGKKFSIAEAYQALFDRYHLANIGKIISDIPEQKDANGKTIPPDQSGGMNPMFDKPVIRMNYADLPPAAQLAMLANAGVNIPPNALMQPNIDQQTKATPPAPDPNQDLSNHPMIKLMDTLQIKFTDLPEDSQQEVLAAMGIPSSEITPGQQKINIEKAKTIANTFPLPQATGQPTTDAQGNPVQPTDSAGGGGAPTALTVPGPSPAPSGGPGVPPPNPNAPPPLNQHDIMVATNLKKRGFNNHQVGSALALMKAGVPNDKILQHLTGGK